MTKYEFLNILKVSLDTELDKNNVDLEIKYYDDYISNEVRKGRSEEDVIAELGDPRLIAKTIKQVDSSDTIPANDNYNNNDYNNSYGDTNNYENDDHRFFRTSTSRFYNFESCGCLAIFILIMTVVIMFRFLGILVIGTTELISASPIAFILLCVVLYYLFIKKR